MELSPQHHAWLKEYEVLGEPELTLLSEFSGEGRDSRNRAAIARYVLNKRASLIRDGREERTLKLAVDANEISQSASEAARKANDLSEAANTTALANAMLTSEANTIARRANFIAMLAAVVAIIAVIISLFKK